MNHQYHRWTDAEDADVVALEWADFKQRHSGISYHSYRLKRQRLMKQQRVVAREENKMGTQLTGQEAVVGCVVGGAVLLLLGFGLMPLIIMLAWNAFAPSMFGAPMINFIQALAMWVFASVLLGMTRSGSK